MRKGKRECASSAVADAVLPLPPGDGPGLQAWLWRHFGIRVPARGVIGGHSAPLDYLRHAFFDGLEPGAEAGPPDCVVWASRGGGKTFLGAVATALDMLYKPGIQIRILGGSLDQSRRMHAHLMDLFRNELLSDQLDGRITERRIRMKNQSQVELLAQSQTSVRGTRVQKVRCDEVELFDPAVWEAVQLATRSKLCGGRPVRGAVECLSTMHVPHGIMAGLVDSARAGKRALFKWGVVDVL